VTTPEHADLRRLQLDLCAKHGVVPREVGAGTLVTPDSSVLELGIGHIEALFVGWRRGISPPVEVGAIVSGTFGYRGSFFLLNFAPGQPLRCMQEGHPALPPPEDLP
jgi:hypothetical protein